MLRTFIACKIPATPALRRLNADLQELGHLVRPVAVENLHVTLKFLGDTDPALIPQIAEILRDAVAGREEFLIDVRGLGVFPHLRRPSVVWVGMRGGEPLSDIASAVERPLSDLGFPTERRKFQPHLTVARIRGRAPRELAAYLEQNQQTDYGSQIVESVELYESELSSAGACYTVLTQAILGG